MNSVDDNKKNDGRVTVRLRSEIIDMIDKVIKLGEVENRSDAVRYLLEFINQLATSPQAKAAFTAFLSFLKRPTELTIWLNHRAVLSSFDDEAQRLYAGNIVVFMKEIAEETELNIMTTPSFLHALREDVLKCISELDLSWHPKELNAIRPTEKLKLADGFGVFITNLTQSIKAGASAKEVSDKIASLMKVAMAYSADDLPRWFRQLIKPIDRDNPFRTDGAALGEAFHIWAMGIPVLYDNTDLREQTKEQIIKKWSAYIK